MECVQGRAGLVQAVESYHMWPEGPMFESRSPRIAQARIRLATNTLPQTPYRAGALCTGYAPMECVQGWRTIMFPQIRYTSKQNHLKHISNHASVSDTYTLSISAIHSTLQCVNKRVQSTEAKTWSHEHQEKRGTFNSTNNIYVEYWIKIPFKNPRVKVYVW